MGLREKLLEKGKRGLQKTKEFFDIRKLRRTAPPNPPPPQSQPAPADSSQPPAPNQPPPPNQPPLSLRPSQVSFVPVKSGSRLGWFRSIWKKPRKKRALTPIPPEAEDAEELLEQDVEELLEEDAEELLGQDMEELLEEDEQEPEQPPRRRVTSILPQEPSQGPRPAPGGRRVRIRQIAEVLQETGMLPELPYHVTSQMCPQTVDPRDVSLRVQYLGPSRNEQGDIPSPQPRLPVSYMTRIPVDKVVARRDSACSLTGTSSDASPKDTPESASSEQCRPTKVHPIIRFYDPELKGTDSRGRTLDEILQFYRPQLGVCRDNHIQWLFPLPLKSSTKDNAPIITDEVIEAFRKRPELRDQLKKSFWKMIWFLHFRPQGEDPDFVLREGVWIKIEMSQLQIGTPELESSSRSSEEPSCTSTAATSPASTPKDSPPSSASRARPSTELGQSAVPAPRHSSLTHQSPMALRTYLHLNCPPPARPYRPATHTSLLAPSPYPTHSPAVLITSEHMHHCIATMPGSWNHLQSDNHLLIARILLSCRVLGLCDEAKALYESVMAKRCGGRVGGKSRRDWRLAGNWERGGRVHGEDCKVWLEGWVGEEGELFGDGDDEGDEEEESGGSAGNAEKVHLDEKGIVRTLCEAKEQGNLDDADLGGYELPLCARAEAEGDMDVQGNETELGVFDRGMRWLGREDTRFFRRGRWRDWRIG